MIQLDNITLRRGPEVLLKETSAVVHAGHKVGLVGPNGSGKSSLFALLLGELEADAGRVRIPVEWTVAHMAQQIVELKRSAIEYVLDGDERLRSAERVVADADASGDGARIATAHQAFDEAGGYDARARAGGLLNGLGFAATEHSRPVGDFSGGWRIRLSLARALMCPSDLLLLDEPTNHLDLETVIWLEDWLARYAGTLVLISHDRDFLDGVVDGIMHIEHRKLHVYAGDYSSFERQRAERMRLMQAQYEKQQRHIAHMRAFVDRFRAKATKARQAQSRLKAIERMEAIAPAHADSPFDFEFPEPKRAADPIVAFRDVRLGYGETVVLDGVSLNLNAGDRIGLLGVNGAGKSTLIKALAGELEPLAGEMTLSRHLQVGYFAQHQLEQIDSQISPLDHLARIAGSAPAQKLRDFLGGFAFSGDLATDPAARLSGGERARLVLAMIIWRAPNLLLLDEPTNHLDLEMRHALTLALQGFAGAVVTVSHDRHLLNETVDEYWLVAVGGVAPFRGGLGAYRKRVSQPAATEGARAKRDAAGNDKAAASRRDQRRTEAERRARLKPLTDRVKKATESLERIEGKLAEVEAALADPAIYRAENKGELQDLLRRQGELNARRAELETEWTAAEEALGAAQG